MWDEARPQVLVIMGVSGCGKSTVADLLAGRLGWDLADGDDMHPQANIVKMATGRALDDDDRWPWLAIVAAWIHQHVESQRPGVITCSALKRSYRDVLRGDRTAFVYLAGSRELIERRLTARHGHFMPTTLLDSQFAALEPPGPDENALTIDITGDPCDMANAIVAALRSHATP